MDIVRFLVYFAITVTPEVSLATHHSTDCSWEVGNFTLDLSALSGQYLYYYDKNAANGYAYTPCTNGLECIGQVMAEQGSISVTTCNDLAYWNSTISPIYNNEKYTFTYNPVSSNIFVASFECGSSSYSVDSVKDTTEGNYTVYTMSISTLYACNKADEPTTTPAPTNNCSWITSDNYELDLSSLFGSMITYQSENFNSNISAFEYFYTPCRNGISCVEGDETNGYDITDAMVTQANNVGACAAYLAFFDPSVQPTYYSSSQSFVFNYQDGQENDIVLIDPKKDIRSDALKRSKDATQDNSCSSPRQTVIEWACNKSVPNGQYQLQYVDELAPCIYTMLIDSPLACATNSTSALGLQH